MSPIQQLIVVQLVSIQWSGTGGPVFKSWEALFFIGTWDLHGAACGSLVALLHALAWRCARSRLGVCMHPLPRFFPLALVRLLADALSAALFFHWCLFVCWQVIFLRLALTVRSAGPTVRLPGCSIKSSRSSCTPYTGPYCLALLILHLFI